MILFEEEKNYILVTSKILVLIKERLLFSQERDNDFFTI